MCTLSWWRGGGCLEVFFNRDEQRTRPASLPAAIREGRELSYIAPLDPLGGGTWIAVNETGLCACLLNGYGGGAHAGARSRGVIVRTLAESAWDVPAALRAYAAFDLGQFAPHHLFLFDPGRACASTWDGGHLTQRTDLDELHPFTTSSVRTDEAVAWRRNAYAEATGGAAEPSALKRFHSTRNMEDPALGVCMDREDARTVSFAHARVDRAAVELTCLARSNGAAFEAGSPLRLRRREVRRA